MKSILSRSAIVASVLLLGLVIFTARTSIAETPTFQPQKDETKQNPIEVLGKVETTDSRNNGSAANAAPVTLGPASSYVATAYSLRGRTASGKMVSRGLIAADPKLLPLGSRVRLDHPGYSGEYLVADTGGAIRGRRIDIWTPTTREAMRFGRRTVKLTVLSLGPRRSKRSSKG